MKTTKILLLGAVVAAFSFTAFAQSGAAAFLRAPILQDPAISSPAAAPADTIAYVAANSAQLSPRAKGNEIKVVKGVASDSNPALVCRNNMNGSPKAVAECASHATMPGCMTIAPLK